MSRNVLVTGGAGYIGSHTCKALHRAGYQPIVLDSLVRGHRHNVRWGPLIERDLTTANDLPELMQEFSIGAVMHFAAYAYVGESMHRPALYLRDNVLGTLNLLASMHSAGIEHIVVSSSCATYGNPARVPVHENDPQVPINPYGDSKLSVEKAIRWYEVAHDIRFVILRYFNAAGADLDAEIGEEHDPEPHLIPNVLAAATGRKPCVDVYGTDYSTADGTAIRDFVHVADLADAHVASLRHLESNASSLALNLGTGEGVSVEQVIANAELITGKRIQRRIRPRREGDPAVLVADARRARQLLGWTPALSSLNTILRSALGWEMRNQTESAA